MESVVVSIALLFVMLLLFVVVYDNNATLRGFLGQISKTERRQKQNASQTPQEVEETSTTEQPKEKGPSLPSRILKSIRPRFKRSKKIDEETEPAPSASPISDTLEDLAPPTQEDDMQALESQTDDTAETAKAKSGGLFRRFRGSRKSGKLRNEQVFAMMTSLDALRDEMNQLASRVTQVEQPSEKMGQLEEALAKVAEDTQMLSEDFKDVLGSLRASIDGLESQLAQVSAGQTAASESEATPDQDTLERIGQLEEALETFNAAIAVFPQELQTVQESIGEVTSRVENISKDLPRTLGYAIQREFKCSSCGSEGLVASQVVCSKCGTGSMWGWWPGSQEITETETITADSGIDTMDSEEQS